MFKHLRKICTCIQAQSSMKKSEYGFYNKILQILPLSCGEERHTNKKYYKTLRRKNQILEQRKDTS